MESFRSRGISKLITALEVAEGAGFLVQQPLPQPDLAQIDPFLLIHELGPHHLRPGEAKGAPNHPHRGFETVSYLREGELEHEDSLGNKGLLRSGDAQWMTAGAGVIHSEMPSLNIRENGGSLHGFQIWVNLPKNLKMTEPRYQDTKASSLPLIEIPGMDSRARLIAGNWLGETSPIQTHTPVLFLDFEVGAGAEIIVRIPKAWNAIVYVYRNSGKFGAKGEQVIQRQMAIFDDQGDGLRAFNEPVSAPLQFLLLAGERINEPMARYGPFVMNTSEEIQQAFQDFQNGTFLLSSSVDPSRQK